MMKILFIRPLNPFADSGASGNRYEGLIKALAAKGVLVHVLVTDGYLSRDEYHKFGRSYTDGNIQISYLYRTFNTNIWMKRINFFLLFWFRRLIVTHRLLKHCLQHCDILWLVYDTEVLDFFLRYANRIHALTFIELNEFNDLHEGYIHLKNPIHRWIARRENRVFLQAIRHIDLIAVMTTTLMQHFRGLASEKAKFLHLPMTVDLERFNRPGRIPFGFVKPYIAYTGTYNNEKDGVDILIRAFATVARQFPEYKLYMAGFDHYDKGVQKQFIEEQGLGDRIFHVGIMSKDQIPAFIQHADLLVMARPDSRQAQGGFPTKLGEYLATGRPVCVTSVGEIPLYLSDKVTAFMATPGCFSSFASAISCALSNKELAGQVGKAGADVARKFFNSTVQADALFSFLYQANENKKNNDKQA